MDQENRKKSTDKVFKYLYSIILLLVLCVAWLFYDVVKIKKSFEEFSDAVQSDLYGVTADISAVQTDLFSLSADLSYVRSIAENADYYAHSHNTFSDQRLKLGIEPLPYSMEDILQLRAVTFYWDKENPMLSDLPYGKQIGMIAHEVEYVIPELVYTDNSGYKHMDYVSLTPILVEAIKDQQSQIDSMQLQIEELSKQLDALYSQIEQ